MSVAARPSLLVAICAAALLTALVAGGALRAPAATPASGAPAQGKALFMHDGCFTCHGTVGQGNRFSGPSIAPHPIPYPAFLTQLRTPRNSMPPYATKILSDKDASEIYAYLRSIPVGKPAADIPILKSVDMGNAAKK